jgi:nucleoside-diphosphate-sugar epimerase
MSALVCLGLGYCARHYVANFGSRFDRIMGTTRTAENAAKLSAKRFGGRTVEMLVFDGTLAPPAVAAAVTDADALLISAAPTGSGDPVLAAFGKEIANAPRLASVVFLSTLGVYPDSGGAWIDENTPVVRGRARRGNARIDAECAWQALGARRNLPVAILRLGGIYGPGQNGILRLLRGTAQRVAKPGHVSNRVHVYDISQAIDAVFAQRADGVFNIVDDEPAPVHVWLPYLATAVGAKPPLRTPAWLVRPMLGEVGVAAMTSIRGSSNAKARRELGWEPSYASWRVGFRTGLG